ncbi:helicase-exonuclease AddAB subunit AddB [Brevibacillus fluminis]|uniref:ATP-dependent helicase/deoxyribonuclease subunit B n=1 Tax=Brevibacillus fluminis TaxID=511487 RepID=A0A3M8DFH7_9BACL|nr:helicase-exonuclease AddAB subunit AddB [Brevibacillus fluminis]RNB85947.1 helicase-exonuclease AddAB subunit AddB [Brevibacillus fluminis]
MSLRLIVGRAGTGKTTRIIEELHERLIQEPAGDPLLYIVPEQATFQAQYRLATLPELGGTIRAQAISFERLSHNLMAELGGHALTPVNEIGKQMVLRLLLERHSKELQAFHRAALQDGFAAQLARMISECKTYGIHVDMLKERDWGTGTLAGKLHDLCLLMNAYDGYLMENGYDADELVARMTENIGQSDWIARAEIWIDGFSGFTPPEFAVIKQLMLHARRVTIALTLDPQHNTPAAAADELQLFYPTLQTYQRLQTLAEEARIEVEEQVEQDDTKRFAASPLLAHIEQHYFSWETPTARPGARRESELSLYTAANRRAEVQAVALQMLALARKENYRYSDMAVLLRNMDDYADELEGTFAEYQIPYFLDQKRTVMHHPLIELIRSALEVVTGRWRYEAVFRCLKTDLVAGLALPVGQSRSEIDQLENYVLAYGIQAGDWKKEEAWNYHGASMKGFEEIDLWRRRHGEPLLSLDRGLKQAGHDGRQLAAALYSWLVELQVAQKLEAWQEQAQEQGDLEAARVHGQVWDGVMELLDQIVEVMGEEQMSLDTFAKVIDSGMEGISLGIVPPAINQVSIGSMERSRQPDVKALFILGVNEGMLPMRPKEDGLLDEAERDRLTAAGIELAPSAKQRLLMEQFLLYQALTRPSERLWLSCALADEEGKALLPSNVFDRLKELLPDEKIRFFYNEPINVAEEDAFLLGRPRQVFGHLLTLIRQMKKGTPLAPFWLEVYNWFLTHSDDVEREQRLLSGFAYTNQAQPLAKRRSRKLYGEQLRMSVSRLERFQSCAFSHFASHGLRLKERLSYRLERFDVGELFHASLKLAVDKLNGSEQEWSGMTEPDSLQLASDVVEELIPQTRGSILNRTARYRYMAGKLKRAVGRAIYVLGEHARRSRFVPIGLEIDFGPGGELPGMTLEIAPGITVQLVGRIDRVDQSVEGERTYLRVIDYKSSPKQLQLTDVWNGLNLQLLVYLDVVVSNAPQWLGKPAEVGGVFYYQVADPFVTEKRALSEAEVAKKRAAKLKMKGLMLADTDLARLMDEQVETGKSDLFQIAINKDGSFSQRSSSVATKEQFDMLQSYVRGQIKQLSARMIDGDIAIAPYAIGQTVACMTCDYKAVCQFDARMAGNEQKQLTKWKNPEVFAKLEQLLANEQRGEQHV